MTKQVQQSITPTHVIGSTGTADTSDLGYRPLGDFSGDLAGVGMYRRANILGTVSQSGGVPTGAIIQRGSNANGEFVKYADGTMLCWRGATAVTTDSASAFSWTPPASFSPDQLDSRIVAIGSRDTGTGGVVLAQIAGTGVALRFRAGIVNTSITVTVQAIGRWF
jgi:hypothetical protein